MYQRVGTEFGKYQVRRVLGVGGMATVYYAIAPLIEQPIALKILAAQYADNPSFRQRFEFEAHITALLSHPNIVPVLDYGAVGNELFIVMPYMSGGSLHDRFILEGAISLQETARILGQLASALDYAHAQGIIHRDLKLANVLLDDQRDARLSDFGIARLADSNLHLTDSGSVLGSPHYMSPEQNEGGQLDVRSDLYSLAVMVYLMITGQFPFHADTALAIALQHLHKAPPPPTAIAPTLPPDMDAVLLKGLAKSPAHRFDSASDFYAAFLRALGNFDTRTAIRVAQLSGVDSPPEAHHVVAGNGHFHSALEATPAMIPPAEASIPAPAVDSGSGAVMPPISNRITAVHPAMLARAGNLDTPLRRGRAGMLIGAFGALILISVIVVMSISRLSGGSTLPTVTSTAPSTNTPYAVSLNITLASATTTPIPVGAAPGQFFAVTRNLKNPVNVRSGPSMSYAVIAQLHANPTEFGLILARTGGAVPWYLISIQPSNTTGWVLGSVVYVLPTERDPDLIPTAVTLPPPPTITPTAVNPLTPAAASRG